MDGKRKEAVFLAVLPAAVFAADQALKRKAADLPEGKRILVRLPEGTGHRAERAQESGAKESGKPVMEFRFLKNRGAIMNLGSSHPSMIQGLSTVMTGAVSVGRALSLGEGGNRQTRLGFSLLLGGAVSNTLDRVKDGYVTDYLAFPSAPGKLKDVVFNLGDFAILAGAALTAAGLCRDDARPVQGRSGKRISGRKNRR